MSKASISPAETTPPVSEGLQQLRGIAEAPPNWTTIAARAVALRILGWTQKEIAAELCVKPESVREWLMLARRRAELLDVGPLLDDVALPLAVDNLIDGLRSGNERFTLATLQGRGAFSSHTKQESHTTAMTLDVRVEMPERLAVPIEAVEGQVVGVARVAGGEDKPEPDATDGTKKRERR
jgi:hypothetical protein